MINPQIHVLPIKALLSMPSFPQKSIAIISSSDEVDATLLPVPYHVANYQDLDYEDPRSFSPELANQMAVFIRAHKAEVQNIYVSCQAAQSRSPAIAAALYTCYGTNPLCIFEQPQYKPNMLCFRLLTDALGVPITDIQIENLICANTQAFKAAINRSRNKQ